MITDIEKHAEKNSSYLQQLLCGRSDGPKKKFLEAQMGKLENN